MQFQNDVHLTMYTCKQLWCFKAQIWNLIVLIFTVISLAAIVEIIKEDPPVKQITLPLSVIIACLCVIYYSYRIFAYCYKKHGNQEIERCTLIQFICDIKDKLKPDTSDDDTTEDDYSELVEADLPPTYEEIRILDINNKLDDPELPSYTEALNRLEPTLIP